MKTPRLLTAVLLTAWPILALAQAPVASVPSVDLARYSGKWFEIASFPMFFQRNCIGDTTAEYAAADKGAISVRNRCRTDSGFDEATGKATVVVGLDPEYRWAVVGNPNRKYLWVLSRAPQLPPAQLEAALASAKAQGFNLAELRYTTQTAVGQATP